MLLIFKVKAFKKIIFTSNNLFILFIVLFKFFLPKKIYGLGKLNLQQIMKKCTIFLN